MKTNLKDYSEIIKSWADQDLPSDQQIVGRLKKDLSSGNIDLRIAEEVAEVFCLYDVSRNEILRS